MRNRTLTATAALAAAACLSIGLGHPLIAQAGEPSLEFDRTRNDRTAGCDAGLNVPWAIGGARIERNGRKRTFPGEWPDVPFGAIRLWDTRTTWRDLEPAPGTFHFDRLDAFVDKALAHGVTDITVVLAGTPTWASSRTTPADASWIGPGSAGPPRSLADWTSFVGAVAERYRGRVTAYEIWNEPNSRTFWSGTPSQWAQLVSSASVVVRQTDPAARIVASGFSLASVASVERLGPWLRALNQAQADIDAISIHWYPRASTDAATLTTAINAVRSEAGLAGLGSPQIWVSEMNVRRGNSLSPARQQAMVAAMQAAAKRAGAAASYWYAWTDLGPPDLLQFDSGTPAAVALCQAD